MADTIRIQVITKEYTQYGEFCDAIYYANQASYDQAVLDGTHEAEKAKRLANYINALENPPAPYEPTKEELIAQKAELQASLDAQIAELDVKIAEKDVKPVDEPVVGKIK